MTSTLELRDVVTGYGDREVVHGVDLSVAPGEVVALLGANGAGKSTTLRAAAGLLPLRRGRVTFAGRPVGARRSRRAARAAALARSGLVLVPEDRGVFAGLTVDEHLRLTRPARPGFGTDEVLARFPALAELRGRRAGALSGGEQQMLALARALVAAPTVLMVDELSLGLSPAVVASLLPSLRALADERQMGVLLVEQQVRAALGVADRGIVLRRGRVVLRGTSVELLGQLDRVESGYLGDQDPDGTPGLNPEPPPPAR
jgi:branched-chain amino acid transport system ATP-binding protein